MKYKLDGKRTVSVTPAEKEILDLIKKELPEKNVKQIFSSGNVDQILSEIKNTYEHTWRMDNPTYLQKLFQNLGNVDSYQAAVDDYKVYLENEIKSEVDKIEDMAMLKNLYTVLYPDPDIPKPSESYDLKEKISNQLVEQYSNQDSKGPVIVSELGKHKNIINDLQKYDVIIKAENKLQDKSFGDKNKQIKRFLEHLKNNKTILTKRKDSGVKPFFKALGVGAASVFGVGVGGIFAHKKLFGADSTKGAKFMAKVKQISKNTPSKR
jgi:hypothetical protein